MTRRTLLYSAGLSSAGLYPSGATAASAAAPDDSLGPWQPGTLEIHHISTGRGPAALVIAPDGSTILIDCGDVHREPALERYYVAARPNSSKRPGQWIARYLKRQFARVGRSGLDYFLLTHFHSDHMGGVIDSYPQSRFGNYLLTGVADILEEIPIRCFLDRGWPDYQYPSTALDRDQRNYLECVRTAVFRGARAERLIPGSASQISLVHQPAAFPNFGVRNLAANGIVWTRRGDTSAACFPPPSALPPEDRPNENMCSAAIRLHYGKFAYYSGGDLTYRSRHGAPAWHDIESAVAEACGPVTVAVANHHGFIDACGPHWVRTLRPQCFIVQAWTSAHPTMPAIDNMLDRNLYPADRSVFSTAVRPESRIAVRQLDEMKSSDGHVVVRVHPGGNRFEVIISSNLDESDHVTARFGPFASA